MSSERTQFIAAKVQAGLSETEIRNELISQGYGTAGFDEEYAAVCTELGVSPKQDIPVAPVRDSQASVGVPPAAASAAPPPPEPPVPSATDILWRGFTIAWQQLDGILATILILLIAAGITLFIPDQPTATLSGAAYGVRVIGLSFVSTLLSLVATTALLFTFVKYREHIKYVQGLQWTLSRLGALIWLSALTMLISFIGFMALIVPGVVFILYSQFALVALMAEDQRGVQAILRSVDLILGHFWSILWRFIFLGVITVVVFLITTFGIQLLLAKLFSGLEPATTIAATGLLVIAQTLISAVFSASFAYLGVYRLKQQPFFDSSRYSTLQTVMWIGFALSVLIVLGGLTLAFLSGTIRFTDWTQTNEIAPTGTEAPSGFEQFFIESRVDVSYNAAVLYGNRMTTFDGVCADVVFEDPVECRSTDESFVIFAPIAPGYIYCRDANGYQAVQTEPVTSSYECVSS